MSPDHARAIAANALVEGIQTDYSLQEMEEARAMLKLDILSFADSRLEMGAVLILSLVIDTLTRKTRPIS